MWWWWWCVVVCGGVWWCVVCGGVWWCVVVCGGVWWCVVVCGGVWWCVVVCGGCADVMYSERVWSCKLTRMQLIKWAGASAPTPSAGLTSRQSPTPLPPKAGSGRPWCKHLTQPQVAEKDCEARHPHPPLLRRKGGRNLFHRLDVECSWSGMLTGVTLPCVFLVRRTLLVMLPPSPTKGQ